MTAAAADIVVTASRREQRLRDVPVEVSAISSDTLRNLNINTLLDVGAGRVPDLTRAHHHRTRGGPSDAWQSTKVVPVAFYVDGISFPHAQGPALELVSPDRLEVLRGPQGQLFGSNAEGGAVQVATKRSVAVLHGDFKSNSAEWPTVAVKAMIDLPEIVAAIGWSGSADLFLIPLKLPMQLRQPIGRPFSLAHHSHTVVIKYLIYMHFLRVMISRKAIIYITHRLMTSTTASTNMTRFLTIFI